MMYVLDIFSRFAVSALARKQSEGLKEAPKFWGRITGVTADYLWQVDDAPGERFTVGGAVSPRHTTDVNETTLEERFVEFMEEDAGRDTAFACLLCDAAARQRLSALREEFSWQVKSIDSMSWFCQGQVPSWIYVLYDWETTNTDGSWHDTLKFMAHREEREKRQRAADEIRRHLLTSPLAYSEAADEFIVELLQDGPAQMTPSQAREYVANMRRRD